MYIVKSLDYPSILTWSRRRVKAQSIIFSRFIGAITILVTMLRARVERVVSARRAVHTCWARWARIVMVGRSSAHEFPAQKVQSAP